MEISELQISQVNKQIEALIKAESFYGKKLEEAGITRENKRKRSISSGNHTRGCNCMRSRKRRSF